MMGILYDNTLFAFIVVTLVLGGGAAWLTGRAVARSWQPLWLCIFYCALLALPVRFLHFSLGDGTLLSAPLLASDMVILVAIGVIAYRVTQVTTMVSQYPWLYERRGPFNWSEKA